MNTYRQHPIETRPTRAHARTRGTRRPAARALGTATVLVAALVATGAHPGAAVAATAPVDVSAATLPDFRTLVREKAAAVVSVNVVRGALRPTADAAPNGAPRVPGGELPEELRKFLEQLPPGIRPDPGPNGGPPEGRQGAGIGSGFIISADGYVVTNAHVVDGAATMSITLSDRRELPATLIGLDEATDLALLKVEADELPVVELGDSDAVEVGQWVLAIGSPFGFDHTATQGIVSAVARNLPSGSYTPFIQTDVAVNPGNSGGPLFDTDGRVIGVNSQIYSSSGGYQGLSFAIPVNVAKRVVEQLRTTGKASRGWLGVAIQDVDQALANAFGLDAPAGALVANVSADGPALAAGVEAGDIIVAVDGVAVDRSGELPSLIGQVAAGESVELSVLRGGEPTTIEVVIGEFADQELAASATPEPAATTLGVVIGTLSEQERTELALEHGVRVTDVAPEGPAASAGLLPGDVIVSLAGKPIDTVETFTAVAGKLRDGETVAVLVQREGRALFVALEMSAAHG